LETKGTTFQPANTEISPTDNRSKSGDIQEIRAGLGDSISILHAKLIGKQDRLTRLFPGLIIATILLGYGAWRGYLGYTRFGTVAATVWSRPWLIAGGIVLLVIGLWIFYRKWVARQFIALYQNGLRFKIHGRKKNLLRWGEIAGITVDTVQTHLLGMDLSIRYRLKIYPNIGKPIHINNRFYGLPEFITQLKEQYYPVVSAALRANLRADHWLYFGQVAIHRQAVRLKDRQLSWENVDSINIKQGKLVCKMIKGRSKKLPISKILNIEVLLSIIQEEVFI
jgi:hypothetical protein